MLSGYIQDMTALVMPKKLGQHDAGGPEHHILSVPFLFLRFSYSCCFLSAAQASSLRGLLMEVRIM